jgi:bacillithiol biosynthesis cysteine-adding enzyme BshC
MDVHSFPASELPHTSKLYSSFLTDFSRVQRFYAHPPALDGARAAAQAARPGKSVLPQVVQILRQQAVAFGADASVSQSLDRLAAGAVAVVTGQQVGLFGGPAYAFYKALTAVAIASELSESGIAAVPVFWLAGEDHDLAEVNHCYWPRRNGLQRLEVTPEEGAGCSVSEIKLGLAVEPLVAQAVESLEGEAVEWVEQALRASYLPQETFSSAFGKLMARLLAGRGMVLLDPSDPRLHRLAATVYRRALEQRNELGSDLLRRNKELEKAGLHAQVKVSERGTLLFLRVDGQRLPVRLRNHKFVTGDSAFSVDELLALVDSAPERFSANVLLRPVVQDFLLPTAAYVGGPAEVAYFAQAEAVYRRLQCPMPAILPRAGFTLVDAHVGKLLRRYGLTVSDLFQGRQAVRRRMEQLSLPAGLMRQFDSGEKSLRAALRKLRAPLRKLDRTLEGALDSGERKMLYQFLKLRGKAGRSENFRTGVVDRHEQAVLESLYPHHQPQERVHNLLLVLARHGPELLDFLLRHCADGGSQHHVVHL